ncbi:MAG: CDP-diacylglycerol--glycerol-3-phosphate 3-phosphatidyltransferase [Paracoccaceae bacterium]
MRWTLPNILTVLRLAAAPSIGLAFAFVARPAADWLAILLFVAAAVTDYLDGHIARLRNQMTAFGRMLDPIADKAMVVIALAMIVGLYGPQPLVVIPVSLIMLREIFVSGLREYLGADAGKLQVTNLAKWKTTAQMVAIPVLFLANIFSYNATQIYNQIGPAAGEAILAGTADDEFGFYSYYLLSEYGRPAGLVMIWLAAALTVMTGWDYLRKAMPFLAEKDGE